jgi:BirA family biotin operon repressor/biotin-[acetyl-CoA-carboxylase] ligase
LEVTLTRHRLDAAALDASMIERTLRQVSPQRCRVEAVAITQSTNDDLVARARVLQSEECVLRATDFQGLGRGRHRRAWCASPGDALLFSIAVPIGSTVSSLPAVTLVCGVALADCAEVEGVVVQLKWPNDVRVNGHKLAGILSELVVDRHARHTLVVGVGVNLRLDDAARQAIGQPAVALDQLLPTAADRRREYWIGRFGGAMLNAVDQFMRDGFDPFYARFNQLLEARGELVDVMDIDGRQSRPLISGRLLEVDRSGCLIIEANGVCHSISSGDVSARASR